MKKIILLSFILLTSVIVFSQTEIEDVLTVIHSRKSVRAYTDGKVSKEQLETLVRAGMAAPTAMNRQPWAFVAIDDRDILDMLSEELGNNTILKSASAAIVVCGNLNKAPQNLPDYWVQDCSAATQNILLATEGIKLGAVWIGVFPRENRIDAVKNVLNLPEYLVPLNVIAIGYPTGVETPKDKWLLENLIWNKYE